MDILDRITNELMRQNKQQQDLTNYLGAKKTLYSDWKSGKNKSYQNLKHLVKIADYLNVSLDYLVFGKEKSPSPELTEEEHKCLEVFDRLEPEDRIRFIAKMEQRYEDYSSEFSEELTSEVKENVS